MVFTIETKELQIISKTSSVLAKKLDKNSLTYDKIKNMCGLWVHPLSDFLLSLFVQKKKTQFKFY